MTVMPDSSIHLVRFVKTKRFVHSGVPLSGHAVTLGLGGLIRPRSCMKRFVSFVVVVAVGRTWRRRVGCRRTCRQGSPTLSRSASRWRDFPIPIPSTCFPSPNRANSSAWPIWMWRPRATPTPHRRPAAGRNFPSSYWKARSKRFPAQAIASSFPTRSASTNPPSPLSTSISISSRATPRPCSTS